MFAFLVSVSSLPIAEAAWSVGDGAGEIVGGVLLDASGDPVAGGVELYAWPTGRDVEVGQTVQLLAVGHGRSAQDGRFSVDGDLTPDLAELARRNGGYVNFVLQATAAGVIEETHFSRYVGDTPVMAQEAGASKRPVEWRASPEETAEPVLVKLNRDGEAKTSDGRIFAMQGGCWGNKLVESQIRSMVIGELRAPPDTESSQFTYGKRADSEIGVASRGGQGPWALSGSFHIANAETAEVGQRALSGEHLLVRSRFKFDRYEFTCPGGRRERIVPRQWLGDIQGEPTAVRGCAHATEEDLGRFARGTNFDRVSEKAVVWERAVEVFGAALTARSGYSKYVASRWRFGWAPADHLLCGDNGPPLLARRIFAGPSA